MTTKLIAASAYQASAVGKNHSNLLELIDAYAEARHAGGCHTYNTKTAEARANVAASLAANAGSEPVAIYHGRCVIDCGAHGHLDMELLKMIPAGSKLYTHPSPPEGMVGGWMPIETAPKDGTEILLHAPACDYEGAYVQARTTYGRWRAPIDTPRIKYQDGFAPEPEWEDFEPFWASWDGGFTEEHPPTHWMPLPPPPTSFADSRKGE